MAVTQKIYRDLTKHIAFSPANSQEEYQAAEYIAAHMQYHQLPTSIEEFSVSTLQVFAPAITGIVLFVGMVLSGIPVVALSVVGMVLAIIPAILAVLKIYGREIPLTFGPQMNSQNVVACHKAEGPLVTKGARPIVIFAHYDSPHENLLYRDGIASYVQVLNRINPYLTYVIAGAAFFQVLLFIPDVARLVVWLLGIVVSLVPLLLAVVRIAEHFMTCTRGANDNLASVAALLGLLSKMKPQAEDFDAVAADNAFKDQRLQMQVEDASAEEEVVSEAAATCELAQPAAPVVCGIQGVRHGKAVLESLGILPENCEIEYNLTVDDVQSAPITDETVAARPTELFASSAEAVEEATPVETPHAAASQEEEVVAEAPAEISAPRSFVAQVSSFARRAALFDLPDPSERLEDPLAHTSTSAPVQPVVDGGAVGGSQAAAHTYHQGQFDVLKPQAALDETDRKTSLLSKMKGLFAKKTEEVDFEDEPHWKGGAALNANLRLVEDDEQPTDASEEIAADDTQDEVELLDSVASLRDDELLAHDVWFVHLGASHLAQAGARAFLEAHRRDIRGSFVVNLNCVGAGNLTVLAAEGSADHGKADRRLTRLLTTIASDFHVSVNKVDRSYIDSDALPVMKSSLRAVSLVGLDESGLPALSKTPLDYEENVDVDQIAYVTELLAELIRRA